MKEHKIRDTLIYSKMTEIEESVQTIKENLPDNFDKFSRLGPIKDGIYKKAEYAIVSVMDICHIINSDILVESLIDIALTHFGELTAPL